MHVLVTGATGKVGRAIASALLDRGETVRALVRDPTRAASILPAGVEPRGGDATDVGSLAAAVEGCELVFNAMGMPEQWVRDEGIFERVNALGSGALAAAAKQAGVRRFIHTSTTTSSTPTAVSASMRRCLPTIRRGPRTSAPSSTPRSSSSQSAAGWRS